MAAIRGKDTKPEVMVRKYLWHNGFRYRLNHPRLPGKPDVVLRRFRTCIFVNGCFWHGHGVAFGEGSGVHPSTGSGTKVQGVDLRSSSDATRDNSSKLDSPLTAPSVQETLGSGRWTLDSPCCKIPHTNREFWVKKIRRNKERDIEVQHQLARMGWHCITVWECELKAGKRERTLASLVYTLNKIFLQDKAVRPYDVNTDGNACLIAAEGEI